MSELDNKPDKYDIALSVSSGALTAAMDVLWVGDLSFADANTWGSDKVDKFVLKVAQSRGYEGADIGKAIEKLEKEFPMDGDLLTNEFGGGSQHHLRDFSHHPTPVGLVFSLLMQFTGKGYGTNAKGEFVQFSLPGWEPKGFSESVYLGSVSWLFHLISDIAGSSGTRKQGHAGTGVPGPLMSFLKEISAIPGVRNIAGKTDPEKSPNKEENFSFSVMCSKMFNGTLLGEHDENGKPVRHQQLRYDLRTELGIINESILNRQYFPVALNHIITAAFYSVRRFVDQLKSVGDVTPAVIKSVDIERCLPWKNSVIRHMNMIADTTFSTIDITVAGIKAAARNKNAPGTFALEFLQGINYWGIGSLAISTNSEVIAAVGNMQQGFLVVAEKQKQAIIEKLPNGQQDWDLGKYGVELAVSIAHLGSPISFASAALGIYCEIRNALVDQKMAAAERSRIERECSERIQIIRTHRALIEESTEEYLYQRMTVFIDAFSIMDKAVLQNDIEMFITGNSMIQNELSGKSMFENMDEFDDMMLSDNTITF